MFVHMLCALVSGSSAFKRGSALPRRGSKFTQPIREQLETRVNPGLVAPLAFDAGSFPQSVAVGDFNGDGVLDLAVANYGSNTVSVLLGTGDGGFGAARDFGVGRGPVSVAVGDFNGDGVLDLAVANANSNTVSVLLGGRVNLLARQPPFRCGGPR